ncbi:MAG: Rid family hydrolase [Desulfovibrionaceae bacterium]
MNDHGAEHHICLEAPPGLTFPESLDTLADRYAGVLRDAGLDKGSEVLVRIHASDIANQAAALRERFDGPGRESVLSLVGQPPAAGGKLALEAYHMRPANGGGKLLHEPGALLVGHGKYRSLWLSGAPTSPEGSYQQTLQVFGQLSAWMERLGGKIENDVQRTWIYMRDVDNSYAGMVDARRELFRFMGLNEGTHYIASTGIEGLAPRADQLVLMDSLSVLGLHPTQVSYLEARDHLCPTHEYAVTFERGTRIVYGDRSHCYISGTASIDNQGNVLHVGDVVRQCRRTLANIEALLDGSGTRLEDVKQLVCYLRDPADHPLVRDFLDQALPGGIPRIIVRGPVCRPTWLVEMEAICATPRGDERFAPFF